jgi:hypothetical protein
VTAEGDRRKQTPRRSNTSLASIAHSIHAGNEGSGR